MSRSMLRAHPALAASALAGALLAAAPAHAAPAPAGCTGAPGGAWLSVTVDGVRSASGLVAISVYADDQSRFLAKGGALSTGRVAAAAGTTQVCVTLPAPGVYELAAYHDENGNRHFDRSGLGLPAEGYGFSNNPATLVGLPAFASVRINVAHAGQHTTIHLKYP